MAIGRAEISFILGCDLCHPRPAGQITNYEQRVPRPAGPFTDLAKSNLRSIRWGCLLVGMTEPRRESSGALLVCGCRPCDGAASTRAMMLDQLQPFDFRSYEPADIEPYLTPGGACIGGRSVSMSCWLR